MSISPIELAQREANNALDRQASKDASLDTKLGLVLALDGAILVGVFTVPGSGIPAVALLTGALILILISTALCLIALIPSSGVQHPPAIPSDFALGLRRPSASVPRVTLQLLNAQLRAWDRNNADLRRKARRFVVGSVLSALGTLSFVLQALLSRAIM